MRFVGRRFVRNRVLFRNRGLELRASARLSATEDRSIVRRIAVRYLGPELGEQYAETDADDLLVRLEPGELRGWDWSPRLAAAGIQRLEFQDAVTRDDFEGFLDDVLARRDDPVAVRYLLLSVPYRKKLNFTWDALTAAASAVERIRSAVQRIDEVAADPDHLMPKQFLDGDFRPEHWTGYDVAMVWVQTMANRFSQSSSELANLQVLKSLQAKNGEVIHSKSGRRLGYGALAKAAASMPVPKADAIRLKEPSQFRYIGTGKLKLLDAPDIVAGKAFTFDDHLNEPAKRHLFAEFPALREWIIAKAESLALKVRSEEEALSKN